jgi:hypothetical protein
MAVRVLITGSLMAAIIVMTAALAVARRAIQRARYGGVALLDR